MILLWTGIIFPSVQTFCCLFTEGERSVNDFSFFSWKGSNTKHDFLAFLIILKTKLNLGEVITVWNLYVLTTCFPLLAAVPCRIFSCLCPAQGDTRNISAADITRSNLQSLYMSAASVTARVSAESFSTFAFAPACSTIHIECSSRLPSRPSTPNTSTSHPQHFCLQSRWPAGAFSTVSLDHHAQQLVEILYQGAPYLNYPSTFPSTPHHNKQGEVIFFCLFVCMFVCLFVCLFVLFEHIRVYTCLKAYDSGHPRKNHRERVSIWLTFT